MSEIVKKIVEELFTNGQGEKANRLVMEFDKHIKGCGWGKPAVRSIISDAINDGSQVNTLVRKLFEKMELIAEQVHKAYCKNHLERMGVEYWTKGDYQLLNEQTKEIDRATVRAVLDAIKKVL